MWVYGQSCMAPEKKLSSSKTAIKNPVRILMDDYSLAHLTTKQEALKYLSKEESGLTVGFLDAYNGV